MKKIMQFLGFVVWGIFLVVYGGSFAHSAAAPNEETVELVPLTSGVWVHTTYKTYNGYLTPSNGLAVEVPGGFVMVDTPWTESQTRTLIEKMKEQTGLQCVAAVVTHAHEDRVGGIGTLAAEGIPARSTAETAKLARQLGWNGLEGTLGEHETMEFQGIVLNWDYPGAGHTQDNMVVWLPKQKVLFGGCLIKSMGAKDKGNVADADQKAWPDSVQWVIDHYPDAQYVVPGHGKWGGKELLYHTLEIVR